VDSNGKLFAIGAEISGKIIANEGLIGDTIEITEYGLKVASGE
jgi:hypothetical protein